MPCCAPCGGCGNGGAAPAAPAVGGTGTIGGVKVEPIAPPREQQKMPSGTETPKVGGGDMPKDGATPKVEGDAPKIEGKSGTPAKENEDARIPF